MGFLRTVDYYFRIVSLFLCLCLHCFFGFLYALMRWGNNNVTAQISHVYGAITLWIAGVRLHVEGKEILNSRKPAIFVSNHQSAFDLSTFPSVAPDDCVIVAKKELLWVPFLGIFWLASGNIFVDRERRDSAISSLDKAVERIIKEKLCVWVFPEGTRNTGRKLLPFKKGAFHMAKAAKCPIVPVVVGPYFPKIFNTDTKEWHGGDLQMKVLTPIEPQEIQDTDIDTMIAKVYNLMQTTLDGLAEE